MTRKQMLAIGGGAVVLVLLLRWAFHSDWPDHEGKIRQTARVEVSGLRRGGEGLVVLAATGHYTRGGADAEETFPIKDIKSWKLALVDAAGKATPLAMEKAGSYDSARHAQVKLPEVADGDYLLRVTYETKLGKGELEVALPLYTPARVHVITDRPLYEAGNTVRFRAVVLRASDLAPLDGRPGRWIVRNPDGEILLEEKAPAGDFGVVAGSFPLDKGAAQGQWHVQWVSAEASDDVPFAVQPFTLPRFRVEATASAPFYSVGDVPLVRGAVTYSSGAPVAGAALDLEWSSAGDWPPPLEWQDKLLPKQARTGADGTFSLSLPALPQDLQGRTTLTARIAAVDAAGDRVVTAAALLLSADRMQVTAVTELGDGLVQGFNNRLYLRATTPDGRVLQGAKIKVKRAWQLDDQGVEAALDEDGVAALQLDPGPPVNVVIPAAPWRPQPRAALVTRDEADELLGGSADLEDQLAMDRWLAELAPCSTWFTSGQPEAHLGVRVNASGAVTEVIASTGRAGGVRSPLERCAAAVVRGKRLPAGRERLYDLRFHFTEPDLPSLSASIEAPLGEPAGMEAALQQLLGAARGCLPMSLEGSLPRALAWRVKAGSDKLQLGEWLDDPRGGAVAAAMGCTAATVRGALTLESEAVSDGFGLIRFAVSLPERTRQQRPQPTTMLGYELAVSADSEGAPSTKIRIAPGAVPPLRMRVTPVLAKAGEEVTAELIRGPSFSSQLPEKLTLSCLKKQEEAKLDEEKRARWRLPADAAGWCEVRGGGVRALLYIKPENDLVVSVTPAQPRYAPRQMARLDIETRLAGKGGAAAVGLFGVDESLGQLVTLAGPDDMERVQPKVETAAPAFGLLDGQALALGRIQGANAAAATVLRVSSTPSAPELDAVVNASASSRFDAIEELTDHFYTALGELYVQARRWEETAPAGEKMKPETMAKLWSKALAACEQRGEKVDDAYGRRLRLHRLPPELLALTAPTAVISGIRLPEDVENWAAWVARSRP